ncbi:MarR family winged helix-turn-helix transcriptional regulator [Streptomyces clavuligerus]|uniref:MarR family winged helix-turn-helix transcriptional regulator n=1 Tax=Streptomyces clavuligerus TaxID=1901 RepID=UPI0035ABEAE7
MRWSSTAGPQAAAGQVRDGRCSHTSGPSSAGVGSRPGAGSGRCAGEHRPRAPWRPGPGVDAKITRSRLSHAVARLEKKGWVRREDCPTDKRGQNAVLTDEGFAVLKQAAPGHVEAVRQAMFDRLTPEQVRQLGEIMRIVAEGLQPQDPAADLPWLR